jgi:hypothetical protein
MEWEFKTTKLVSESLGAEFSSNFAGAEADLVL